MQHIYDSKTNMKNNCVPTTEVNLNTTNECLRSPLCALPDQVPRISTLELCKQCSCFSL